MTAPTRSPVFGSAVPRKEHLTRGRGNNGEITDLRNDVEAALFDFRVPAYTNLTRPTPSQGKVIFNTDDAALNVGDGTDWRDMAGNVT